MAAMNTTVDLAIISTDNTTSQVQQETEATIWLRYHLSVSPIMAIIRPIVAVFGVISSVLLLVTTISNPDLPEPVFICYQAMVVVGLIYSGCEIVSPIYRLVVEIYFLGLADYFKTNYTWSWLRFVGNEALFMYSEDCTVFLITFLSLHRAAACFFTKKISSFDQPVLYVGVTAAIVLGSTYNLAAMCWEDVQFKDGKYTILWPTSNSYLTYVKIRDTIHLIRTPAVIVSAGLSVAGLIIKVYFKRRSLLNQVHPLNTQNPILKRMKRNVQMCCFQLSQAIPLVIFSCLNFIVYKWYRVNPNLLPDFNSKYAYQYTCLWSIQLAFETISNDLHFYLLLIFSKKFRLAFVKRCLKRGHSSHN